MRRLLALAALFAIAQARYAGRPLADVLRELQGRGLNIVYSSDLVKPEARVLAEPRATNDRRILDEVLAPHGLVAKNGPRGVILVIRADVAHGESEAARAAIAPMETPRVEMPVSLGQVVVTASDYAVLGSSPEHRQFLSRQEVNRMPHLGDDIFRTLNRLPGAVPTSDYSASFGIRGSTPEDVLVLIDGLEIAQPFHMRYFQNVISVVDSEAIGGLDYLSGGIPVEYGDRIGGVIDMSTLSPSGPRTYAGASFTHARLLSAGTFHGDRGQWLVSARRGYFDLLLDLFYKDITARPRYGDVIGKVQYRIGDRSVLSMNVLSAVDHFDYDDFTFGSGDIVHARYDNHYGWLNLRSSWTPRLTSQIVTSYTHARSEKNGGFDFVTQLAEVRDKRKTDIAGMRQDWTYDRSDRGHYAKWGLDVKRFDTAYDYQSTSTRLDLLLLLAGNPAQRNIDISMKPRGTSYGVYVADRMRLSKALTVEAGARYERESWSSGDAAVTPRINAVFTPSANTAIRASWGELRQAQRLDAFAVEDGDATLYPAQRSRQAEIGVEHHFSLGFNARVAAYRNKTSHVRPRYENLFDHDEFFPEATFDRVRIAPQSSDAHGIELMLKDDGARPLSWWVSLTRSSVTDRIGSADVPRAWDQPTVAGFSVNYHLAPAWNFNVTGQVRSGSPTTEIFPFFTDSSREFINARLGPINAIRVGPYRRFDVRAMRSVATRRGTFSFWIDVTNMFNRINPCCGENLNFIGNSTTGVVTVQRAPAGIGWLPSFGVAWEF